MPDPLKSEMEAILLKFAEDLIAYEQRMIEAGAPPVRFIHKYTKPALTQLTALVKREVEKEVERRLKQSGYVRVVKGKKAKMFPLEDYNRIEVNPKSHNYIQDSAELDAAVSRVERAIFQPPKDGEK